MTDVVETALMRSQFLSAIAVTLVLQLSGASAQSTAKSDRTGMDSLSVEQQSKVGDLITKDAGMPLAAGQFQIAVGNTVPPDVQLRAIPGNAGEAAPQVQNKSYAVVEEQIAIVDPTSRKITAVLQRGLNGSTDRPSNN
jgi:hypothetical protein